MLGAVPVAKLRRVAPDTTETVVALIQEFHDMLVHRELTHFQRMVQRLPLMDLLLPAADPSLASRQLLQYTQAWGITLPDEVQEKAKADIQVAEATAAAAAAKEAATKPPTSSSSLSVPSVFGAAVGVGVAEQWLASASASAMRPGTTVVAPRALPVFAKPEYVHVPPPPAPAENPALPELRRQSEELHALRPPAHERYVHPVSESASSGHAISHNPHENPALHRLLQRSKSVEDTRFLLLSVLR